MRHLKFGLLFIGLVVAAPAAATVDSFHVSSLDLSTIQFTHSATDFIPPYQFTASVVLTQPADKASAGSWAGSRMGTASMLSPGVEAKSGYGRAASSSIKDVDGNERVSLSHLLRLEFKADQLKVSLRPNAATFEGSQFKFTVRPGSTLMQWRKELP